MIVKILRAFFALIMGTAIFYLSDWAYQPYLFKFLPFANGKIIAMILGAFIGALVGYLLSPILIRVSKRFSDIILAILYKTPTAEVISGTIGGIIGLIIGYLLTSPLRLIPIVGAYLPIFTSLLLGYLGLAVGVKKRDDITGFFSNIFRFGPKTPKVEKMISYKILDTSVIIDGRIADIIETGFLEGTMLIPGFVLEELRHIADSGDNLRRNRGRRGLDVLNRLRKEGENLVQIYEGKVEEATEVDIKLLKLATKLNSTVVTNDFNLNKVAELMGVKVLNINDLANALKTVVLPGEEMLIQVIKDGKEANQGLAYLDDGTLIVVENGKKYIGNDIEVVVTSVLQTSAGRMIFAKAKAGKSNNGSKFA